MSENQNKSIFANLWERRVPQFIATYVGICWGILQFLIFATTRYGLGNHYIDRFLIFTLVLLPAVGVFIYNHGAPGKDKWKQYEKVLIPLNFVVALLFAGLFSGGNEMNAAPKEVTVTTELGDTITRLIPAMEQTKSFAVFPFLNKTPNEDQNWMKFAISDLLRSDMEQDMRFYCLNPYSFDYSLESKNHSIDDNSIPFVTYNKIAKDKIVDFFITGEYTLDGDKLSCSVKIYETKTGEVFYEKSFDGNSIFEIVDTVNKELGDNLYLENNNDKIAFTDLPASNLITGNLGAMQKYYEARSIRNEGKDFTSLPSLMREANELDPLSAILKSELATAYMLNSKMDSVKIAIAQALDFSDGLPERQKFRIKQKFYQYNDHRDKYIPLLESWKKLYPNDFYPYQALLEFYTAIQNTKKGKAIGIEALNNGHGSRILKKLAGICISRKEFDEAEKYLNEYYNLFPDKKREEDVQLADVYLQKGQFTKAKDWYESISILKPNDYNITIKLANVYTVTGDFDKSQELLNTALGQAKLREDSIAVYFHKVSNYYKTGEVTNFKRDVVKHYELISPGQNKMGAIFAHMQMASLYAVMGQEEMIYERYDDILKFAPHLSEVYLCVADFLTSMMNEDMEKFEKGTTPKCHAMLTQATPTMDYLIKGIENKVKKNHSEAIRFFETYIDTTESNKDNFGGLIAEQYRLNGNVKKGIEYCLESLKLNPYEGTFLLELTKSYLADGQIEKAKETLKKLKNKVWHKAEPEYIFYDDMMSLREELNI